MSAIISVIWLCGATLMGAAFLLLLLDLLLPLIWLILKATILFILPVAITGATLSGFFIAIETYKLLKQ